MKEILIDAKYAGGRLDKLLTAYLNKAPRSFVYKMLRKKNIVLNDKKASGNELLKEGDSVKIYFSDETIANFHSGRSVDHDENKAAYFKSCIIYEDDNIIVINKPAGLLSQNAAANDISLNGLMLEYLKKEACDPDSPSKDIAFKPGISNRLDRNTSGIILAGKNPGAARELNAAVKNRSLKKIYACIVCGKAAFDGVKRIESILIKDEKNNKVTIYNEEYKPVNADRAVTGKKSNGLKDAADNRDKAKNVCEKIVTEFEVKAAAGRCSLLQVNLITGKSHQIRAQAEALSFPVIGDPKYGNIRINNEFKSLYNVDRQLLHAGKVIFNGMTGILEYLNGKSFEAVLPEDFLTVMKGEDLWPHGTAGV